jgi:hypothetical protein
VSIKIASTVSGTGRQGNDCGEHGDHTYEQSKRDFDNVDQFLQRGAFIIFDDSAHGTDWGSHRTAREAAKLSRYEVVIACASCHGTATVRLGESSEAGSTGVDHHVSQQHLKRGLISVLQHRLWWG